MIDFYMMMMMVMMMMIIIIMIIIIIIISHHHTVHNCHDIAVDYNYLDVIRPEEELSIEV